MALVAQGDKAAFDRLVRRYLGRACAMAGRFGGLCEAEDVAQEAFLKLWINAPSWKPGKAKFSTWFYRIVMNAGIDRFRARKPSGVAEWDNIPDPAASADNLVFARQERQAVMGAVLRLPEKQRVAVTLCYSKGLTNQDAADIMGIHIKSLEGLLSRARKSLKDELKELREAYHDAG